MDDFVADAIYIDAPPSRVFAALLDPEEVLVWMDAQAATVGASEGGEYAVDRGDGSRVVGSISGLVPGERLEIGEYCHEAGGLRRGPMSVTFLLEAQGEGTWLTVRQDALDSGPDWKDFAQRTRKEWVRCTVALKRQIEGI